MTIRAGDGFHFTYMYCIYENIVDHWIESATYPSVQLRVRSERAFGPRRRGSRSRRGPLRARVRRAIFSEEEPLEEETKSAKRPGVL